MTKSIKYIIITFIIGCGVFLIGSFLSNGFDYKSISDFLINFFFYQLYTFVLSYTNTLFFEYMKKRQFQTYEVVKRILYGISGSTIITLICIFFLRILVEVIIYKMSFNEFIEGETWSQGYAFGLWITMSIISVFYICLLYTSDAADE